MGHSYQRDPFQLCLFSEDQREFSIPGNKPKLSHTKTTLKSFKPFKTFNVEPFERFEPLEPVNFTGIFPAATFR